MKLSRLLLLFAACSNGIASPKPSDDTDLTTTHIGWQGLFERSSLLLSKNGEQVFNTIKKEAKAKSALLADEALGLWDTVKKDFSGTDKLIFENLEKVGRETSASVATLINQGVNQAPELLETIKDRVSTIEAPKILEAIKDSISTIHNHPLTQQCVNDISLALKIDYAQLSDDIKAWIQAHPYQTAFLIIDGVVFFYPGLFSTHIL